MRTGEVVKIYENRIWIEADLMGDAHVMIQSSATNCKSECIATVKYSYPYVDNATRDKVAREICRILGESSPETLLAVPAIDS